MPTARPGAPPARPASPAAARRMPVEAPAKSGGGAAIAIVVVLLVALAGVGGWWFLTHRTNPQDQARKYFTALKAMDWKALYEVSYLSEEDKKKFPNAQAAVDEANRQLNQNPQIAGLIKMILPAMEIKSVGEPTYANGEATVPVKLAVAFMGQSSESTVNVQLKNELGVWKVVPNQSAPGLGSLGGGGMGGGGMGGGGMGGGGMGGFSRPGGSGGFRGMGR